MQDFKYFVEHLKIGNFDEVRNNLSEEFVNKIIDDEENFPIHIACKEGFVDIVNLLLQHNCNFQCENKKQMTPILLACQKCEVEIVKLLLQHNCNIECESKYKWRPIHYAVMNGDLEMVKLLLQHNCNIEHEDSFGKRPIHYACTIRDVEMVKFLLEHNCNIECETLQEWRPIHYACWEEDIEIVKTLIQHNCNIECENNRKLRPIHYACKNEHVDIVKLLLRHNCNIEFKTKDEDSLMAIAKENQNKEIIEILNANKLLIACKKGIIEDLPSLLDVADIEYCDEDNRRPIHWAFLNGHIEIVKLLIERNCSIDIKDKFNLFPMAIAENNNNEELIKILKDEISYRPRLEQQRKLLIACKKGIIEDLPSLLDVVDIEYCDEDNRRPIHWACLNGHIEIVKLLIERNCSINVTDKYDLSPMIIAENKKNKELTKFLQAEIAKRPLERQILMMGLTCKSDCEHKLCPKSLKDKSFDTGLKIGIGGFGEVYKCKGSGIDKIFAIKKLKLKYIISGSIEGNIDKFLPILNHVRIIQYFGSIQKNKYLWIFMEFVPGGSLQDKITTEKTIENDKIIHYSKQILEGLQFLHENNIIHRDLKPANILIDLENDIKLLDFGFSRSLLTKSERPTNAHTYVGTLNFIAPEVMNSEFYNVAADIWSLGATIINMITGKPLYDGYESVTIKYKILTLKKYELPQSPAMSNEMKIFIEQMLNSNPDSRPSAADLLKFKIFSTS